MTQSSEFGTIVDPANPGQFFACCGILELAGRLWSGAEGWFDDGRFFVSGGGTLADLMDALTAAPPIEVTTLRNGLVVKPLIAPLQLPLPGKPMTLDAWMTIRVEKGEVVAAANPPWNFWSGQQTPLRIWSPLRAAVREQIKTIHDDRWESLFDERIPLTGRFGFDPGAAWNALDVGFSPNEQRLEVASSPAVELLAAVGVQRFRPKLGRDRESFVYSTWGQALQPCVAAAAAAGLLVVAPAERFRGRVISRGSYAALGYSTLLTGDNHE